MQRRKRAAAQSLLVFEVADHQDDLVTHDRRVLVLPEAQ